MYYHFLVKVQRQIQNKWKQNISPRCQLELIEASTDIVHHRFQYAIDLARTSHGSILLWYNLIQTKNNNNISTHYFDEFAVHFYFDKHSQAFHIFDQLMSKQRTVNVHRLAAYFSPILHVLKVPSSGVRFQCFSMGKLGVTNEAYN